MWRQSTLALVLLLAAACTEAATVQGRVSWPNDVVKASKVKLALNLDSGNKLFGWPRADGQFSIHGVPEGVHILDVFASGVVYPQYRLDVKEAYPGGALATHADDPSQIMPPPLLLKPVAIADYFEACEGRLFLVQKREPFSVMSFIKTPYGLMLAFGLFAVVVLPRMKIDPEELREAKESLSGGSSEQRNEQPRIRNR